MARYGANELFNPGGRRRRKTGQASVTTGSQSGSLGPMPHSQAPDALGMLTSALDLADSIKAFGKDDIKTDTTKNGNGNGFSKDPKDPGMDLNLNGGKNKWGQKSGGGASQEYTNGKKKKKEKSLFSFY